MKDKAVILFSILMLWNVISLQAQEKNYGSRFGHGKDSIECLLNIGLSREYVKSKNYKKAYAPWKEVISSYPKSQACIYSDGVKILHALLDKEKDIQKRSVYLNELTDLYDKQYLYCDDLNKQTLTPIRKEQILVAKAYDYLCYGKESIDLVQAYKFVREAIDRTAHAPVSFLFPAWMDMNLRIYKEYPTFRNKFIEDYHEALFFINKGYEQASINEQEIWNQVRKHINEVFIKSGLSKNEKSNPIQASINHKKELLLN